MATHAIYGDLNHFKDRKVPDVIRPGLKVLFCGINPGLLTAATGHHFARPGNRFWPALYQSGFTPRLLLPSEKDQLLELGLGITNVVDRATAVAAELKPEEYKAGGLLLEQKILTYEPKWLAVLGVGSYREAFGKRKAQIGLQPDMIGRTRIWLLPNPSGLNAHYTPAGMAALFRTFKEAVDAG